MKKSFVLGWIALSFQVFGQSGFSAELCVSLFESKTPILDSQFVVVPSEQSQTEAGYLSKKNSAEIQTLLLMTKLASEQQLDPVDATMLANMVSNPSASFSALSEIIVRLSVGEKIALSAQDYSNVKSILDFSNQLESSPAN